MAGLIPPELQDLSSWPTVDPSAATSQRRADLLSRIEAIRLYVDHTSLQAIEAATGVQRSVLYRLMRRCIQPHPVERGKSVNIAEPGIRRELHRQIDFFAVTVSEANLSTNNRPREVCQFAALTSRIARKVLIHSEFPYTIFDTDQRAPSSRHEAFDGVQPQTRRAVRTTQNSIRRLESSASTRAGCSQNEMTVGLASSRIHCSRPT